MTFVKPKWKEIREEAEDGTDMRDSKYIKIMSPTNALEQAQKEFYVMYNRNFNELLKKLPLNVEELMQGRAILAKDKFAKKLGSKPLVVQRLFNKTKESFKDFFRTTSTARVVGTDQFGNPEVNTLPIYYVGTPKNEEQLKSIEDEIQSLTKMRTEAKTSEIANDLQKKIDLLQTQRKTVQSRPSVDEISLDMTDSLLRFAGMAQNYETMQDIEDTVMSFMEIIKNKQYSPASGKISQRIGGKLKNIGINNKGANTEESNVLRRARKWLKMVYYDNEMETKTFWDKSVDGLIAFSSLSYVGFNVFGNINNYLMGRLNNTIETVGGRYYDSKAMLRAVREYNGKALPEMLKKLSHDYDQAYGTGRYKEYIPATKYEALVEYYRMLDPAAEMREQTKTQGKEGWIRKKLNWGYVLQDAGEYNVQSKVGVAILMSTKISKENNPNETLSLYDAYNYNNQTGELTLKEGYEDVTMLPTGDQTKISNDKTRYDIRNYIREVNKQIHGNYAYEDRMVIQAHSLGKLVAQFHKWTWPAIKARFRKEYFDENLGWLEGRYRTFWTFAKYTTKNLGGITNAFQNYKAYETGEKGELYAKRKLQNVYRTLGEIGIVLLIFQIQSLFKFLFEDDDDDSVAMRRLKNAMVYQTDRLGREMLAFWPLLGTKEQYMMIKSPIASSRMMGEMGEAVYETLIGVPYQWISSGMPFSSESEGWEKFKESDAFYKRTHRKGQLKLGKEWGDALPVLYTINRWTAFDNVQNFHVK